MAEGPEDLSTRVLESDNNKLTVSERLALARSGGGVLLDRAEVDDATRHKVLAVIARDAEALVRQALSETLANSPAAPRDIILQLARDEELVAAPVLAASPVLTDSDLIDLLCTHCSPAKMVVIAGRAQVSPPVSHALIEIGDAGVTLALMDNPGAAIADDDIVRIVDRFGAVRSVQIRLVDRSALPVLAVQRMIRVIADDLVDRLVARHTIPREAAMRIAGETKERAVLGLTNGLTAKTMNALLSQMDSAGDISYAFILRVICTCNPEVLAHIIALRTRTAFESVSAGLAGGARKERQDLWTRAALPKELFDIAHGMLDVLAEADTKAAGWDERAYRSYVIDRTLRVCSKVGATFQESDMDCLLDAKFAVPEGAPPPAPLPREQTFT